MNAGASSWRRRWRKAAGQPTIPAADARRAGTVAAEVRGGLEAAIRERLAAKPLLVMAHAVVGYPSLDANREMLAAMAAAGVDLVELQLPFSEPIADGHVFVRANQEA